MDEASRPIGVFDSGVGGLTVVREIAARLPHESIWYLGDTARVPYGTKSPGTVVRYARACANCLVERGVKLLVVACNTAASCAVETLRDSLDIPVVGVILPGARAAVAATRNGRIGVIGTPGTVASGAYQDHLAALSPDYEVHAAACPLFVPLAEEGWTEGQVPEAAARRYLTPLLEKDIDTLVLGCTHYPLLREVIGRVVGGSVTLVDSAEQTAKVVAEVLEAEGVLRDGQTKASYQFLVSDDPESFARTGAAFWGRPFESVEWIDF